MLELVKERKRLIELIENNILTTESVFVKKGNSLKKREETLQKLEKLGAQPIQKLYYKVERQKVQVMREQHSAEEQSFDESISAQYEILATATMQEDPNLTLVKTKLTLVKAKLEEFEMEIKRDEEEAEALM